MSANPTLFYCPRTRSAIAGWMNEELGAPCDIKIVDIRNGEQDTPDYLAVNPMGKVPALVHDGVAVTEAAAICAYLADAYADKGLAPALSDPHRGAYYRWMFFAPACIEPAMLDKFTGVVRENPASVGHGLVDDVLRAIDHALEAGPFVLGDKFSAADVVFGSTLNFATMFGAFEARPKWKDYLARLTSRPAFIASQEKDAALAKELGLE